MSAISVDDDLAPSERLGFVLRIHSHGAGGCIKVSQISRAWMRSKPLVAAMVIIKERSWSKEEREKNSWSAVSMHFDLHLGVFMSRVNTIQPETGKHFACHPRHAALPIIRFNDLSHCKHEGGSE
jgi:hypothetical protein